MAIENLGKAYLPARIRKGRRKRKNKSSTPNIKVRNFPKENQVLNQVTQNVELDELEKLRLQKQKEELEILQNQRNNIEQLKQMQNDPNYYSVVHENDDEDEGEEEPIEDTLENADYDEVNEPAPGTEPDNQEGTNHGEFQAFIREEEQEETADHQVIQQTEEEDLKDNGEGDNDTDDNDENSKVEIIEGDQENVMVVDGNSATTQKATKAKGKGKKGPKIIKRVFPNCIDVAMWKKRNKLEK